MSFILSSTPAIVTHQTIVDHQNSLGKTTFHLLLESSLPPKEKEHLSANILKYSKPNVSLLDNDHHSVIDCAMKNPMVLCMFFQQNLIGEDLDLY